MTSAMTYGAKKTSRRTRGRGSRWLSISARPRANGIWTTSDRTMIDDVVPDGRPGRSGRPAPAGSWPGRRSRSAAVSPFHLKKLKWTAWTIGNSTKTTYRASAGSRNSAIAVPACRGPRRCARVRRRPSSSRDSEDTERAGAAAGPFDGRSIKTRLLGLGCVRDRRSRPSPACRFPRTGSRRRR